MKRRSQYAPSGGYSINNLWNDYLGWRNTNNQAFQRMMGVGDPYTKEDIGLLAEEMFPAAKIPAGLLGVIGIGKGPKFGLTKDVVHYSVKQNPDALLAGKYGTNWPGEEYSRLTSPVGKEVKPRVFFYGKGVTPESRVGPYPVEMQLSGLYDAKADPDGLMKHAQTLIDQRSTRSPAGSYSAQLTPTAKNKEAVTLAEQMVRDAGYRGMWFDDAPQGPSGFTFEDIDLTGKLDTLADRPTFTAKQGHGGMVPWEARPGTRSAKKDIPELAFGDDNVQNLYFNDIYRGLSDDSGNSAVAGLLGEAQQPQYRGLGIWGDQRNPNAVIRATNPNRVARVQRQLLDQQGGADIVVDYSKSGNYVGVDFDDFQHQDITEIYTELQKAAKAKGMNPEEVMIIPHEKGFGVFDVNDKPVKELVNEVLNKKATRLSKYGKPSVRSGAKSGSYFEEGWPEAAISLQDQSVVDQLRPFVQSHQDWYKKNYQLTPEAWGLLQEMK